MGVSESQNLHINFDIRTLLLSEEIEEYLKNNMKIMKIHTRLCFLDESYLQALSNKKKYMLQVSFAPCRINIESHCPRIIYADINMNTVIITE